MSSRHFFPHPCLGLIFTATALLLPAAEETAAVPEVTVQTALITRATLRAYVTAYGHIETAPAQDGQAAGGSRLAPATAGIVAQVACHEGQQVEVGTLLFQLDSRAADVAVIYARLNLEKQKELLPAGGTSGRNVREAEQQLATAEAQQALLRVVAPFAGTITRINARPGEAVDLTSVLAELVNPAHLVATVAIPATELDGIATGHTAELTVPGHASTISGHVLYVSPQIDPATGTALTRISVPTDAGLRLGEFVSARIVSGEPAPALVVPRVSLYTDPDGASTLSIVTEGKAHRLTVHTGIAEGELVAVSGEGLAEEQTVVTVGAYALPDGAKVKVRPSVTP